MRFRKPWLITQYTENEAITISYNVKKTFSDFLLHEMAVYTAH